MSQAMIFSLGVYHSTSVSSNHESAQHACCSRSQLTFALPPSVLAVVAGRSDNVGVQYSPSFEREGDSWRLKLMPIDPDGEVQLYLELVSQGRPADYSVDRWYRVRALHPTDASRSVWMPSSGFLGPHRFVQAFGFGIVSLLEATHVADFSHSGFVTLQAVVWKPTAEESAAAAKDPEHLQLLRETFSSTAREVIDRVIAQQGGEIGRAYVELRSWSDEELKQPLTDEAGRENFS